eukprot:TRINITY_DN1616_c0_g1_i1.p1 TRINITY_DN1616_c0_g1~~TRINITY_DN1616_c0_g1_i1.p1  ORF type:complete len:637 (+),score=163.69 TRINITY_DN1616_c0_g1_i1:83-1993(+)
MRGAKFAVLLLQSAMGQVPTYPGNEFVQQYAGSFQSYIPGPGEIETPSPIWPGPWQNVGQSAVKGWAVGNERREVDEKGGGSFRGYTPVEGDVEMHGQVPLGVESLSSGFHSADYGKAGPHVTQLTASSGSWSGSSGHGDLNFGSDHKYMKYGMGLGRNKGNSAMGSNAQSSQDSSQQSFDFQKYMKGSGKAGSHGSKDSSQQSFDYQKYMQGSGKVGSDSSKASWQQSFDYQKYMQGSGQTGSDDSKASSQQSFNYQKYMQGSGQAGSDSSKDSSQQSADYKKFMHGPQKPAVADAYNSKDSSQPANHQQVSVKTGATHRIESEKEAKRDLARAKAARKRAAREVQAAQQAAEADATIKRAELKLLKEHEEQVVKQSEAKVKESEAKVKQAEELVKHAEAARETGSDSSKDSSQQSFDHQKFMHRPQKPTVADAYSRKDSSQPKNHQQVSVKTGATHRIESEKEAKRGLAKAKAAQQAAKADATIKRAEAELKLLKEHEEQVVKQSEAKVKESEAKVKQAEELVKHAEAAREQKLARHVADHKEQAKPAAEDQKESKQNVHEQPTANSFLVATGHGMTLHHLVPAALLLVIPDPLSCAVLAALACAASYCVKRRTSQPAILEERLLPQEEDETTV